MTVNAQSPLQTGIKLLPFTLVAAIGSVIANLAINNGRIPVIYVYWFFSALSVIGTGLLTTLGPQREINRATYGYECLAGLGMGAVWGLAVTLTPNVVEARDFGTFAEKHDHKVSTNPALATANGALVEFRILGGAIGIAIMASILENHLNSHLANLITPDQLSTLKKTTAIIKEFPPELREKVLRVFADGYQLQMKVTTGFAALQPFAIALLWKKKQIRLNAKDENKADTN